MAGLTETTEWLQLLGETNRVRLLALLQTHDLSVAELTAITELGQSRVSTHLGKLREAGVVRDRKAGASTFYRLNEAGMPSVARNIWQMVRANLQDDVLATDEARREKVLKARAGESWPESLAGEMERHYSPGRTWEAYARGLAGLLGLGHVLDVGAGDGAIAELLAPQARKVVCFDRSEKLLSAARARLAECNNVAFEQGDMHELPFAQASFDHVLLLNVLTQTMRPERVLSECARVSKVGARLVVVTLAKHSHPDITAAYHHVHAGFTPQALTSLLSQSGFAVDACSVAFRERREPHFSVLTAFANKKDSSQ